MNCAICGKDNQAGTRYCVHCGAALAAPAGGSQQNTIVAAGAILSPKPPAAPSFPASEPTATIPPYTPRAASAPPPMTPTASRPTVEPAPPIPAYNADPKRAGLIVIAIAVVGVLAIVGYFGFKAMTSREAGDVSTRVEAPPSTASSPQAPTPNEAPPASPKAAETPQPPQQPAAETPPTLPPEPPVAPPKAQPKPRTSPAGQSARQPAAPVTAVPAPAPAQQPPARAAAPPSSAPVAEPVQDRWAQFAEDLRRCQSETFLSRVVCDQRVRIHYCEGYWGKVPQCPGAIANPDRGQ